MENQQLKKLVKLAIERKWWTPNNGRFSIEDTFYGVKVIFHGDDLIEESVNDVLFGDNLGFLKALVGDRPTPWMNRLVPANHRAAMQLAILPDDERIPWLYQEVSKPVEPQKEDYGK